MHAKHILKEEPRALFVHCLAHYLNLSLQNCGRQCSPVREALYLSSRLASLIRSPPKAPCNILAFARRAGSKCPGTEITMLQLGGPYVLLPMSPF